ncbi:CAIB/BAIF CoA-transferase family protein (macronuclear) [Tetrahymena thermophila SB210]|uniref:CAIB/BAIF CoA-transferase family protein n=1 Tax=Tetrahymena thermophila (strain SB210) TaxID=312017 RepID=I7LSX7_TETTS|nr:CAIB/BAIF CoA-transferase family protein [Tetrahymena thermophila SB210]EAR83810.2 CAIB/BAIF CoA-transferase family protein [Tetrahymena thermophila SB210]|eukprot:XP_001031473.2 CAIB/BAIF CoA-transferase family protein [Tetrahymena thermophila SB210]
MLQTQLIKKFFSTNQQPLLKGIRVIDLSRILAGPFGTMYLSDLGAEVIKIESFEGDETRKWGPPFANKEDSSYFLCVNRNKKSICLNLKSQEGQKIVHELVQKSDIVAENYSQGVTQKLNLDYETLNKINQRIIYASISGYGDTGPMSQSPAFDLVMQARSGFMHISGQPDGPPTKMGFAVSDVLTGLNLANGILAALYYRQVTGRGMHVKTSLQESSIGSLVNISSQYLNGGQAGRRMGNNHPSIVPYGVYKVKNDEYIVLGSATNDQFKRFCKVIGIEEILSDEKFKNNSDRVKNRVELDEIINKALQNFEAKQLTQLLEENKIPGGNIYNIQQMFEDEQVKHLQMAEEVESTKYPNLKLVRNPINYSEGIKAKMVEPPSLNEHCDYVLSDILQYSQNKINQLRDQKVIL